MNAFELTDIVPPLPSLGADVVAFSCETTSDDARVEFMRPRPPSREIIEFDDDCSYVAGYRTDEEMAELQAIYERDLAKWVETNGKAIVKGPIVMRASVTLSTGARVELIGDGTSWRIAGRQRTK